MPKPKPVRKKVSQKPHRYSGKDVVIRVLTSQEPMADLEMMEPGKYALQIAWNELKKIEDSKIAILEEYLTARGLDFSPKSHSRAPKVGEQRTYRVQCHGENEPAYIRLPLNALGLGKNDRVTASFTEGNIVIEPV